MRHRQKSERFSRPEGQRRALKRSLLRAIIREERIKTSHTMGKALTSWIAKLITLAKTDNLHNRRQAYSELNDHLLVKRLFEAIAPRFKDVAGGYTRMFDTGLRKGDGNLMSLIELTKIEEKIPKAKKAKGKKEEQVGNANADAKKTTKKAVTGGVKKLFAKKDKKETKKESK
jgi:large subunit ribosomal protein L17